MNLLAGASLLALAKSIYYNKGEGVGIRKQCTYGCLGVFTILCSRGSRYADRFFILFIDLLICLLTYTVFICNKIC